jgi:SAM-dependent methyltransferase
MTASAAAPVEGTKGKSIPMFRQILSDEPHELPAATVVAPGRGTVTPADLRISAQARSLSVLDRVLDELVRRDPVRGGALLDLGCGTGGLAAHVGRRLGITDFSGVDCDRDRLRAAAARGIRPLLLNLDEEPVPMPSGSVRVATCFGVLAYLALYDNVLCEAARLLEPRGWLLLSMPNLGSYANRLVMLWGYQPHSVAVSRYRRAGTIGRHRDRGMHTGAHMPPLLHGATLRCMRELLNHHDFDVEIVRGFAPRPHDRPLIDPLANRFPSLSRRFLIVARKRVRAAGDGTQGNRHSYGPAVTVDRNVDDEPPVAAP